MTARTAIVGAFVLGALMALSVSYMVSSSNNIPYLVQWSYLPGVFSSNISTLRSEGVLARPRRCAEPAAKEWPSEQLVALVPQEYRLKYVRENEKIQGWMEPVSAGATAFLSEIQHKMGIRGDIGEIGVHQGRYFIALAQQATRGERLWVADLFEEHQDQNIDRSGAGSRRRFVTNLRKFGINENDVILYTGSSAALGETYFRDHGLQFRLFSVDGGHTAALTANDLHLATCAVVEGGIVVLDDFYNVDWLGVANGFYDWLQRTGSELRPFLFDNFKLYLTSPRYHARYLDAVQRNMHMHACFRVLPMKTIIAGYQVAVVPARHAARCRADLSILAEVTKHTKMSFLSSSS